MGKHRTQDLAGRVGLVAGLALALTAALTAAWPDGELPDPVASSLPAAARSPLATGSETGARAGTLTAPPVAALAPLAESPPTPLAPPSAPLAVNVDKLIAKLEKKLAKKEAKLAKKLAKEAEVQADESEWTQSLADANQALLDAELLPQTTPEELKAYATAVKKANKALKKANKKLGKLAKKLAKLEDKILDTSDVIEDIESELDYVVLDGGLPEQGEVAYDGLRVPNQMPVVAATATEPSEEASGILPGGGDAPAYLGGPPTDYTADEARVWVYDPSMEALDQVNSILCMLTSTAYDVMVNEGPYIAQIDEAACGGGGGDDGGTGQSSGSTVEQNLWIVNSVRPSESGAHYVGVWVPETGDGPDGQADEDGHIHVRMRIQEGISEQNPFGVFALDFASMPDDAPPGDASAPMFWGTLETEPAAEGFMAFSFFETGGEPGGDWFDERAVHVNMSTDGSTGVGRVEETRSGPWGPGGQIVTEGGEYAIAFDASHVLRTIDDSAPVCLSRDAFVTRTWRYNLYHATGEAAGQRVALNGGFGFTTDDGEHGWASYWGVDVHQGSGLDDGEVVIRDNYDSEAPPELFTVLKAPGRLIRNERLSLPLEGLDLATFEWWNWDPQQGETRWLLEYRHGDGQFWTIAAWQDGEFGGNWVDLDPVDVVALDLSNNPWLGLWSQSLGGPVNYLDGDPFVTFFQETTVNGASDLLDGETEIELLGWIDMVDSGITGSEAQQGDVFLGDSSDVEQPHRFVFKAEDLTLHHDVNGDGSLLVPAGLAPGESYDGGPFHWGMRSGPMVMDAGGLADVFDAFDEEVFFTWETGPNPWNQYAALVDVEGGTVSFDPPIQFTYAHTQQDDANDDGTHAGKTYHLEYNGPGQLHGIPHEGLDLDGDGWPDRWYPMFSLADGTLMGPTGSEYVVRAIESEQQLAADPGGCDALSLDVVGDLDLPDGSSYGFPNIGAPPVLAGPPSVIDGEIQDDG